MNYLCSGFKILFKKKILKKKAKILAYLSETLSSSVSSIDFWLSETAQSCILLSANNQNIEPPMKYITAQIKNTICLFN